MGANLAVVFPSSYVMLTCIQDTELQETALDDVSLFCLLYCASHVGHRFKQNLSALGFFSGHQCVHRSFHSTRSRQYSTEIKHALRFNVSCKLYEMSWMEVKSLKSRWRTVRPDCLISGTPAKPSVTTWPPGVIWPFKYLCVSHDGTHIKHKGKDVPI